MTGRRAFVLTMALAAAVILSLPALFRGRVDTPYRYPVLPGTEEWAAMSSLQEKIDACAVEETLLESMTTPALLETVLDYPLLVNMMAFSTVEQGIASVSSYFDGIRVLEGREDALEVIRSYPAGEDGDPLTGLYLRALAEHIENTVSK